MGSNEKRKKKAVFVVIEVFAILLLHIEITLFLQRFLVYKLSF